MSPAVADGLTQGALFLSCLLSAVIGSRREGCGRGEERGGPRRGPGWGPGLPAWPWPVKRLIVPAPGVTGRRRGQCGTERGGRRRRDEAHGKVPARPPPAGPGGLGQPGGRAERGSPRAGRGASSCPVRPRPSRPPPRRHLPLPPEGAPKGGRCPASWLPRRRRWDGAGGLSPSPGPSGSPPARLTRGTAPPGPPLTGGSGGTPLALPPPPCPAAGLVLLSPAGSFVPGRSLLPFIPGVQGTRAGCPPRPAPCTAADTARRGGYRGVPPHPPISGSPLSGRRIFPLPQPFPYLQPLVMGRGKTEGPHHPGGASCST